MRQGLPAATQGKPTKQTHSCSLLHLLISSLLLVSLAIAQQDTSQPQSPATALAGDTTSRAEEKKPAKEPKEHRGSIVFAPIPTSSPAVGTGATLMGGYIFPLIKSDKISPPSVVGGAVMFTNNGTRGGAFGTELYFKQDRYHVLAGIAKADVNYDFYGTGTAAGNAGIKFGLNQTGTVFFGEVMRRTFWHVFIGPRFWFGSSTLSPQKFGEKHPDLPPLNVNFTMRAIGFKIERDTTPNRFYPVKGTMLNFGADFFSKGLGGTFTFQTYRLKFNYYHSFDPKTVLAYNAFVCSTGGKAPFFGQCIFGLQNELRGYPAGRYIDKKMIATQAEFRRVLAWRLGMVAFVGLGEVAPSFSSFNGVNLLGSIGGGARFNLSTKYHVNLSADIAQGRDDHTFSMGLGEAF